MKTLRAATLGVLLFVSRGFAGDWTQWRGPERTGHVPEGVAVPETLPADPKIIWHIKIGFGLSSPVVSEGKVFYSDAQGDRETLHAVQAVDGKPLWQADIDKVHSDSQSLPGPRCTPLAGGDRVYAQSCRGELRCLKISDGKELWSVNYTTNFSAAFFGERGNAQGATRHGNDGSPAIDGDRLFAPVGGTNGESVVCFEKATGKVIWKSQNDEASYAAPVVVTIDGTRQLVDFNADALLGLALSDGKLLWRTPPLKTSFSRHVTTPVIIGENIFVASQELGMMGFQLSHTGADWGVTRSWQSKDSAMNFSSPVAVGNYLYGLGPEKNFICVDGKTGKQAWSHAGYINTSAGQAHAAFIVMGKNILALTDGGELVLFAADPTAFKEISIAQVCSKNWCNPAYADGKLYLRDAHELYCVGLLP
ncbi:MAG TPA: PQQ-binding-like beta-propeller repeat protein [Verrucomicrobiae bacterium]|jgi:outer membrane protein assembly factor BamB|nr:PQQ-binding-like beta-propeller repeat protein [Verrucomicrobiae bacterium]